VCACACGAPGADEGDGEVGGIEEVLQEGVDRARDGLRHERRVVVRVVVLHTQTNDDNKTGRHNKGRAAGGRAMLRRVAGAAAMLGRSSRAGQGIERVAEGVIAGEKRIFK
jgi:hypothetical protein